MKRVTLAILIVAVVAVTVLGLVGAASAGGPTNAPGFHHTWPAQHIARPPVRAGNGPQTFFVQNGGGWKISHNSW
jgi:hypothetical protein